MTVSSITPVNNYAGNGSTTTFDFDFLIENADELKVQITNNQGVQSTLTLNTDYTIHEVGNEAGSYITYPKAGSTHTVLASDEIITLSLDIDIEQEKEIKNSSKLNLVTLEWCLDYLTRICQIQERKLERSIKVQESTNIDTETLVNNINNVSAQLPVIQAVNANQTNINAVNANKANINTVAGNNANVIAVANIKDEIVGVEGISTEIVAVDSNKTNINTVAGSISNVNTVATNTLNINAVAGNATNINAVNANKTNINAVAGNATNINAVNANKTNINTVAVSIANVNTTAGSISNVNTVAGSINKVNAVGTDIANVNTCADNITAITDAPSYAATCQQIKEDISAFDFIDGGYSYTNPVNIYDGGNASNGAIDIIQGSNAIGLNRITFDDMANINQLNKTNLIIKELSEQVAILTNILNSLTSNIDGGNAVA